MSVGPGTLVPMFPVPTPTRHISPLAAGARDRGRGQVGRNAGLPAPGGEARSFPSSGGPRPGHFLGAPSTDGGAGRTALPRVGREGPDVSQSASVGLRKWCSGRHPTRKVKTREESGGAGLFALFVKTRVGRRTRLSCQGYFWAGGRSRAQFALGTHAPTLSCPGWGSDDLEGPWELSRLPFLE